MITVLPPLRRMVRGAMASFEAERFDVRAGRFRDSQPVERKQAHQCVMLRVAEAGGDEHGSDFVAIQSASVRFVVELGATDVHRWRLGDEVFLFGVPIEASNRAETA
jgi:hypothetical protein